MKKIYYVEKLKEITGWGNTNYERVSPFFKTEEQAIKWMKSHYKEKDYTFNGYCTEVLVTSDEVN